VGIWPLARAAPQRALLLLSDLTVRRHAGVPHESANKRLSHLAGIMSEVTNACLATLEFNPFARTPLAG
jgi:hypothetical protein